MKPETRAHVDTIRMRIGAALLEVQNLGKKHRIAVGRLEAAYMDLAAAVCDSGIVDGSQVIEDLA